MSNIILSDGCPTWEGQAVRFDSPRFGCDERMFVHEAGVEPFVEIIGAGGVSPGILVADLGHRPTFIYLAVLIGERFRRVTFINTDEVTWGRLGMSDYGPLPPRIRFNDPAALLALWLEVSRGALEAVKART